MTVLGCISLGLLASWTVYGIYRMKCDNVYDIIGSIIVITTFATPCTYIALTLIGGK